MNDRPLKPAAPMLKKRGAANATQHAQRRQHRLHQGNTELDVAEERLVTDELQILVPAQFGVAAKEQELGVVAPALKAADTEGEHAVGAQALVVASVGIDRPPVQEVAADLRRPGHADACRLASHRTKVAEHRGLVHERQSDRHHVARLEQQRAEVLLLEILRFLLKRGVCEALAQVNVASRQLQSRITG